MKRDRAKELLRHYLRLACEPEGCELDFDCYAEIDEIVDAIIEAAVTKSARRVADLERVSAGAQDDQAMSGVATCRVCGCTDDEACEGGCYWVEDPEGLGDLCSRCLQDLHKRFEAAVRANISLLNLGSPTEQLRAALHGQASKEGGGNASASTTA